MRQFSRRKRFLGALLLSLATIIIMAVTAKERERLSAVERAARDLLLPLSEKLSTAAKAAGRGIEGLSEISHLRRENEALRQRVHFLEAEVARLKEAEAENVRLRRLLSFLEQGPYEYLPAQVIGRTPGAWESTLILNRGSRDGVFKGMAAVLGGELVGRVTCASARTCSVMLLTASESSVAVMDSRSRELGVAMGVPGSATGLRAKFFSPGADVVPGDMLITSGLGSFFPKGIVVGEVRQVSLEEYGLVKYADVEPAADLGRLEEVLLIKGSDSGS